MPARVQNHLLLDGESKRDVGEDFANTSGEPCLGCPFPTEVNQEIVDFAVGELHKKMGTYCPKDVEPEDFKSQAGFLPMSRLLIDH